MYVNLHVNLYKCLEKNHSSLLVLFNLTAASMQLEDLFFCNIASHVFLFLQDCPIPLILLHQSSPLYLAVLSPRCFPFPYLRSSTRRSHPLPCPLQFCSLCHGNFFPRTWHGWPLWIIFFKYYLVNDSTLSSQLAIIIFSHT